MNYRSIRTAFLSICALMGVVFFAAPGVIAADEHCEDLSIKTEDQRIVGYLDETFEYDIEIEGGEADSLEVRGTLPTGVEFEEDDRELRGTPEKTGTYVVALFAENDCDTAGASLRIDIAEQEGSGNVSVTSTFDRGDSSVNLSDVPYTGIGDTLRILLIILALLLWSGALAFIFLGPGERAQLRSFFGSLFGQRDTHQNASLIDRSNLNTETTSGSTESGSRLDELNDTDIALLQRLRDHAYEEKVLVTERVLAALIKNVQQTGSTPETLLTQLVEEAKTRYSREDGLLKIDAERFNEMISQPTFGGEQITA